MTATYSLLALETPSAKFKKCGGCKTVSIHTYYCTTCVTERFRLDIEDC